MKNEKFSFHQTLILVGLLGLIIAQTFSSAIRDRMHQRIPECSGSYTEAISIVISHDKFNLDGYAAYRNVYNALIAGGFDWAHHEDPVVLNKAIDQARRVNDKGFEHVLFWAGDIGFIDYVRMAFKLFGYNVESFLYLYFLILFIQVALFFIQFRKNDLAMAGLILFLLSHYIIVNGVYGAGYNLWAVHNNRFLSVLGILPIAHICLLAIFQKPIRLGTFLGAVFQTLIFIFVLRCRNSANWMIGPLLVIIGLAVFGWVMRRINLSLLPDIKVKLWPILIVLVAVFLSIFIKPYIMDAEYFGEKNLPNHTVWHTIYIGMAINPEIREIYGHRDKIKAQSVDERFNIVCHEDHSNDSPRKAQARKWLCSHPQIAKPPLVALSNFRLWLLSYTQNDQDSHREILKWLRANGKTEEHLYTFGPKDKVGYPRWFGQCDSKEKYLQYEAFNKNLRAFDSSKDFKWREMERIDGLAVKDALRHHPVLVLKTAFIIKPFFFFLYYIMYFLRITSLWGLVLIIVTYGYLLFYVRSFPLSDMKKFLAFLLTMFVFSMVVTVVTYPAPHTISDQALLLTMCIFGFILYKLFKIRK